MVYLREWLTRGFKTRFFAKTNNGSVLHISKLYGVAVRSIVYGKGFIEYSIDNPQVIRELYEVSFTGLSLKTSVYEPASLKVLGVLEGVLPGLSSGYSAVDRVVGELGKYREFWTRTLCSTPQWSIEYYVVDSLARGSIGFSLYGRVKELIQESSREFTGFVLGVLVSGLVERGFKTTSSTGDYCYMAEHAERVSWAGSRITMKSSGVGIIIDVEKRMGAVNPDIAVERNGIRVLVECKTGPPKTWLTKAVKQAMLYREVGKPVLVTTKPLGSGELEYLSRYYQAVLTCTPDNTLDCQNRLLEVLEN